ncbi:N-acetyltransferase [Roseovarius sp. CAU 1744]|uniref:GNAT family N-acetyltransferase n=1 Tax=Roseovarius sp. CAU 1744 TaxID=3140368 RepID=UPI00325B0C21
MTDIAIDPVTPDTLDLFDYALRQLSDSLGDPHRANIGHLRRAMFGELPACYGLIAREPTRLPSGAVMFSPIMSTRRGCAGLQVTDLWVAPGQRGLGVGRRLLAAASTAAQDKWRAGFLWLSCYTENTQALEFYARLGFVEATGDVRLALSDEIFDRLREI